MERMLKARAGAARMTLMNTQDTIARGLISKAQAAAIVELASKEPDLPSLSAEARASLQGMVSEAPWSPDDLVKVLQALSASQADRKGKSEEPKEKYKRLPTQV